jgi:hypothetical protein
LCNGGAGFGGSAIDRSVCKIAQLSVVEVVVIHSSTVVKVDGKVRYLVGGDAESRPAKRLDDGGAQR